MNSVAYSAEAPFDLDEIRALLRGAGAVQSVMIWRNPGSPTTYGRRPCRNSRTSCPAMAAKLAVRMTAIQHRVSGLLRVLKTQGTTGVATAVAKRLVDKINERVDLAVAELPVRPEDLADSSALLPAAARAAGGRKLRIGWVCAPPSAGSGGHTTLFRMVETAEQRGHECTLFLYDKNSDDVSRHEGVIREHWKGLKAGVHSATAGMAGMDAVVASSWGAAHVVAMRAPTTASRFYFIQDFEPYFYPRGALLQLRRGYVPVRIHQHRPRRDDCGQAPDGSRY